MRKFTRAISENVMGSPSVVGRRQWECRVNPSRAGSIIAPRVEDIIHSSKCSSSQWPTHLSQCLIQF